MPVDPITGEKLPYPGDPGFEEGGAPAEAGGEAPAGEMPTVDELDALLGQADEIAAEVEGGEGAEDEEGAESEAKPLMETLGISQERAEDLLAAAKEMDKTKDMDATQLAEALEADFQLRMELEKLAAQMTGEDPEEEAAAAMEAEGMMPPGAAPAGPPMGGPPMGGM